MTDVHTRARARDLPALGVHTLAIFFSLSLSFSLFLSLSRLLPLDVSRGTGEFADADSPLVTR